MNVRGQSEFFIALIVFIFVALVFLGGFSFFAFSGKVIDNKIGNEIQPNLIILNADSCKNQQDQFGFSVGCTLQVKNLENKPIELAPVFECYKISSSSIKERIVSSKDAIPSQDSKFFSVTYDNDGREWTCEIVNFGVENFN